MWKIVALGLLLAGCAAQGPTKAQTEIRDINAAVDAALRQSEECTAAIEQGPEYGRLSDRLAFGQPPMALLADKRRPTEADVPILLAIHRQLASCRAQTVQAFGLAHPAFVSGVVTTYTEADIEFAKLVRRDISWGEYAELGMGRFERFRARYREAARSINTGLRSAHVQEMQDRQAAGRALAAWAQAQQSAFPVTTSCVYRGPILSCSSY